MLAYTQASREAGKGCGGMAEKKSSIHSPGHLAQNCLGLHKTGAKVAQIPQSC